MIVNNCSDKKIFSIIVSSFNYGGIEILVKRMAKILEHKYSVHIFLLTNKYDGFLVSELKENANVYFPKDYLKYNFLPDVAGCNSVLPIKKQYVNLLNKSTYIHVTDSHCLTFLLANLASGKPISAVA